MLHDPRGLPKGHSGSTEMPCEPQSILLEAVEPIEWTVIDHPAIRYTQAEIWGWSTTSTHPTAGQAHISVGYNGAAHLVSNGCGT